MPLLLPCIGSVAGAIACLGDRNQTRFTLSHNQGGSKPGWADQLLGSLLQGYVNRLIQRVNQEPQLHKLFLEVTQMLKPPTALYHPKTVLQTLKG